MTSVTAFAPATVSNVACGFDVLGFALDAPGDEVTARLTGTGVRIDDILGDGGRLPRDAAKNTAGIAALALLTKLGERRGVALTIRKGLPLSSGLGGSAASAAAAVVAVDAILGSRVPIETLIACALEGERLGAGSAHADNIAPSLCGGLVLVRCPNPPDVVRLRRFDLEIGMHDHGAGAGAHRRYRPARRCRATVGESRRAGRRSASRGLRIDQPVPGGHHRGAAAGVARPRSGRDQARGARRRRARVQSVGVGSFDLRAVRERGSGDSRGGRHDRSRAGGDWR